MKMLRENFTMNDLEPNMVIELRNGTRFLVLSDNIAISEDTWMELNDFDDDLAYKYLDYTNSADYDIMKVFKTEYPSDLITHNLDSIGDSKMIWKRCKSISETFEDITDRINKLDHNDTIKLLDEIDKLLVGYESKE